ncbi:hypothetical protein BD289DRAFT_439213 [Coniella lustricola]|uniref:Secreted protein n=1 Tax=Coniella lustricola TaxID=2025994 RepID=A0A2T3A1S4_9PEZI|nr:hypothetical protein BD289DRAFT_439213 [Coniella lustricola]
MVFAMSRRFLFALSLSLSLSPPLKTRDSSPWSSQFSIVDRGMLGCCNFIFMLTSDGSRQVLHALGGLVDIR